VSGVDKHGKAMGPQQPTPELLIAGFQREEGVGGVTTMTLRLPTLAKASPKP